MTMRHVPLVSICLLICTLLACQQNGGKKNNSKASLERNKKVLTKQDLLPQVLDSNALGHFLDSSTLYKPYADNVRDFYAKREYHYAWVDHDSLTEQAGNFMNMVRTDPALGNDTSGLQSKSLDALYNDVGVDSGKVHPGDPRIAQLEMMLTAHFFLYADKIWGGRTSDSTKGLDWYIPRKKLDMASLLQSVISQKSGSFTSDEPVNRQYKLLRDELKKLADVDKAGQWDTIAVSKNILKPGQQSPVVTSVKIKLHALGDLPDADTSASFTPALDSALRNFEDRMGLKVDGQITPAVVKALNVPLKNRMEQILVNMERLRWVPADPSGDYLLVNIPAYKLYVYEDGKLAWNCNVVVGKPGGSTVIFTKKMQYVVFSPYWNVAPGILAHEVLPAVKRNPGYLARENMEVVTGTGKPVSGVNFNKYSGSNFPYIIRQKPGGKNSLGKVKFLFPNEYNIYLHDTPSKGLFNATDRSFSHGCIRVQEPEKLANWVLRKDSLWNADKIHTAMNAGKEKYVQLKGDEQVPVYISYFTAFVDSQGRLNMRSDVYGHDAELAKLLFAK
ncbi:Murein L,D-transpeptidase YcbB/YkuD [Chitinophaga costaii]|uniref:Murein L,D-transpeptidase YcbB/YkuD n=1 Tax=Chitinophaga costaii TaxID=1335309 RepID=A0A1C4FSQ6_9BACT|nr:Murein L,D-transpeptidase YcbB/YkuD [Chitinophaga costaii]